MGAYEDLLSHLLKSKEGNQLPLVSSIASTDLVIVYDKATGLLSSILKSNLVEDRFITISGKRFTLHKHPDNSDSANILTQELYDVVVGYEPSGEFFMGKYLGGDATDFFNVAVYEQFGGI